MGMIERKKSILMSSPHLETASGGIASFSTDMGIKPKECKIHFSPVQEGSGDPSPTNIRPITGWTGVTITHCGKNIIDFEAVLQSWNSRYTKTGDNSYRVTSTGSGYKSPYIFSANDINISASGSVTDLQGSGRWRFEFLNSGGTRVGLLGMLSGNSSGMYQVPNVSANKYRLNFGTAGSGATYENIQVELGTECTSYEPYKGIDIPISWQSEAGTVYGGYVDLTSGELVQEWANISSYNGEVLPDEWLSSKDTYAPGTIPTTGAQVVYKLATPTVCQLTLQTIQAFIGRNNIWSDAGNVEVKYWTH